MPSLRTSFSRIRRPVVRAEIALIAVAAYLVVCANPRLWSIVFATPSLSGARAFGVTVAVAAALFAITLLMLLPLSAKWLLKTGLSAVLLLSALAAHFVSDFHVVIDRHALASVYETTPREAGEWISLGLLRDVLLLGALPAALLWWVRIEWRKPLPELWSRLKFAAATLTLLVASAAAYGKDIASLLRNHMELRHIANPFALLAAHLSYLDHLGDVDRPLRRIGLDARRSAALPASTRPLLIVLAIGESTRAQSIDLNGYARDTGVDLRPLPIVNFPRVSSCGTNTATSLPCMFSGLGRDAYDDDAAKGRENLLDVLMRGGYDVLWLDNNTGSKGLAARARERDLADGAAPGTDPAHCNDQGCYDQVLLDALAAELPKLRRDTVVVLHLLGSHGPAYYARYPPPFARFLPECRSNELQQCSDEQLRNSYDNSVLYTTHILAEAIAALRARAGIDASLLFLSDHGESLGEKGFYLHGAPYAIAPAEQTHVPMLLWSSPGFATRRGLDFRCLRARSGAPLSHDHFFHSVLGLAGVETASYRQTLDVFSACVRRAESAMPRASGWRGVEQRPSWSLSTS